MIKHRVKLVTVCCLITIAGVAGLVLASVDTSLGNFDAYQDGDLNSQAGWSDSWNSLTVQDQVFFSGTKAIKNQTLVGGIGYKAIPVEAVSGGVISTKIKITGNSLADNQEILGLFKGESDDSVAIFRFANNFDNRHNLLLLSRAGSTDTMPVGQITQDEWHKIMIGWRQSDFKVRFKLDNQDWTDWLDSQTTWDDSAFGVRLTLPAARDFGDWYLDDLNYFIGEDELGYDPLLLAAEATSSPAVIVVPEIEIPASSEVVDSPAAVEPSEEATSTPDVSSETADETITAVIEEDSIATTTAVDGSGTTTIITSEF